MRRSRSIPIPLHLFPANSGQILVQARNTPKPSSMVPFQRDSAFVGREDILAKIRGKHEQVGSHSRVALVGLGGVGSVFRLLLLGEAGLTSLVGSLRLPSNTRIERRSLGRKPGCFGCMRAMRIGSSKRIEILLPRSNFLDAITRRLISSSS